MNLWWISKRSTICGEHVQLDLGFGRPSFARIDLLLFFRRCLWINLQVITNMNIPRRQQGTLLTMVDYAKHLWSIGLTYYRRNWGGSFHNTYMQFLLLHSSQNTYYAYLQGFTFKFELSLHWISVQQVTKFSGILFKIELLYDYLFTIISNLMEDVVRSFKSKVSITSLIYVQLVVLKVHSRWQQFWAILFKVMRRSQWKQKPCFWECFTCFKRELWIQNRGVTYYGNFLR